MAIKDIQEILNHLPHRYPMLLIDRVLELEENRIVTLKNVTINEPFFPGHYPGQPVMPGVLIIEVMAQTMAALTAFNVLDQKLDGDHVFYLAGVDKVRFRQPVLPGDQLIIEGSPISIKRSFGKFEVRATVDGKMVASAELMSVIKST